MDDLRALVRVYLRSIVVAIHQELQYRAAAVLQILGFLLEPLVYLSVWTRIADTEGEVGGYTGGGIAAYYVVWTLVRTMNIAFSSAGFEWRIKDGQLNGVLLRPVHPVHLDLATYIGNKIPWLVCWLPVGALLTVLFHPALHPTVAQCLVFLVAIWGAYLVRALFQWNLGLVAFWTTRASALFEIQLACELLLSGRMVPLSLMPGWVQAISFWTPFYWTFGFPIDVLVGHPSPGRMAVGLVMQCAWAGVGALILRAVWRRAVARYAAVGN